MLRPVTMEPDAVEAKHRVELRRQRALHLMQRFELDRALQRKREIDTSFYDALEDKSKLQQQASDTQDAPATELQAVDERVKTLRAASKVAAQVVRPAVHRDRVRVLTTQQGAEHDKLIRRHVVELKAPAKAAEAAAKLAADSDDVGASASKSSSSSKKGKGGKGDEEEDEDDDEAGGASQLLQQAITASRAAAAAEAAATGDDADGEDSGDEEDDEEEDEGGAEEDGEAGGDGSATSGAGGDDQTPGPAASPVADGEGDGAGAGASSSSSAAAAGAGAGGSAKQPSASTGKKRAKRPKNLHLERSRKRRTEAERVAADLRAQAAVYYGQKTCHRCGAYAHRDYIQSCNVCDREYCGRGGKEPTDPLCMPCIDVIQCNCGTYFCYDCIASDQSRSSPMLAKCIMAAGDKCLGAVYMCYREWDGKQATCVTCQVGPVCRPCRMGKVHEAVCTGPPPVSESEGEEEEDEDSEEEEEEEEESEEEEEAPARGAGRGRRRGRGRGGRGGGRAVAASGRKAAAKDDSDDDEEEEEESEEESEEEEERPTRSSRAAKRARR